MAFGDWDMLHVALDWGIRFELEDWRISLGYALDWQIGRMLGLDGEVVMDPEIGSVLDCICIGGLAQD